MRPIRDFFLPIAASGALVFGLAQPAAAVTLVGDTLTAEYSAFTGTIADDTFLVVDPGVEIAFGDATNLGSGFLMAGESIDFSATSILMTFTNPVTLGMTVTGISGTLTGISTTVLSGAEDFFSTAAVLIGTHSFSFEFVAPRSLLDAGGIARIDLTFADNDVTQVPLPGGLLLLFTGLAGLGLVGARGKAA